MEPTTPKNQQPQKIIIINRPSATNSLTINSNSNQVNSSLTMANLSRTFICLPSPSSSPSGRVFQYVLTATSSSSQHPQIVTAAAHQEPPSSETDAPKLHAILSSPLPPAYPWASGHPVSPPVSPRSAPSSPFNARDLVIDEPLEHDDMLLTADASSEQDHHDQSTTDPLSSGSTRRGRPRLDDITSMIAESNAYSHHIRCKYCARTFPREKSLQAHLRTHTGEVSRCLLTTNVLDGHHTY